MDVTKLNSAVLRNLLKLSDKRDSLLSELSKIEKQLSSVSKGGIVSVAKGKPGRKGRKKKTTVAKVSKGVKKTRRGRKGGLKKKILAALSAAGSTGVTVKALAAKLKVPPQNIHVWFSSTGKGIPSISKIAPGKYKSS